MGGAACNAELGPTWVNPACALDEEANRTLARAANRHRLSARGVHRLLRVARTIADLAGDERVCVEQLMEALRYRVADSRAAAEAAS